MSNPYENTILLVHPSTVDPLPFLGRKNPVCPGLMIGLLRKDDIDSEATLIPWLIDNKYYTAQTTFQSVEFDSEGAIPLNVDVLVYIFDSVPKTLPGGLIKSLVDDPKDIALAIKIRPDASKAIDEVDDGAPISSEGIFQDGWEEVFEEVGFVVIDETAQPEEDDERPIDALENIRQTLMTHLWPSMVRKPISKSHLSATVLSEPTDLDPEDLESEEGINGSTSFPTKFNSAQVRKEPRPQGNDGFPGLAELKAQIEMDDFDRFDSFGRNGMGEGSQSRLDRLNMIDDLLSGPGMEEYARLDEWLDEDENNLEGQGHGSFAQLGEGEDDGDDADDNADHGGYEEADSYGELLEEGETKRDGGENAVASTFEDDFDDFAAFQSASRPQEQQLPQGLTMDPTPLLMHLQSVRAELAGLDEEERRARAGKEVARVMRDLGFDDIDATELLADNGEPIE